MSGRGTLREKTAAAAPTIEYPTRDGRPMGESDEHRDALKDYAVNVLRQHFLEQPRVYVSGNNFIYYTENSTEECVSPDCYVVRGVPKKQRDCFKTWEEGGQTPCFVLEITSKSTRREDRITKRLTYQDELHVPEYFLFDPRKDWIGERLAGYLLLGGSYQSVQPTPAGRLPSRELGLELGVDGNGHLRFFVPGATEPLPTSDERADRAEEQAACEREQAACEREQAARDRIRAEKAEAELTRLRAELERLRRSSKPTKERPEPPMRGKRGKHGRSTP